MANGTVKGELTQAFKDRIADLQQKAQKQSEQLRDGLQPRPWHTPESMAGRNLLDVANLHEPAWNRDEANRIYSLDVLRNEEPGTAGDIASLKKQIDFMAVEERAWRLRHASLARCATLAHGRLAGHGDSTYGIFAAVKNVAQNHLLDGAGAVDKQAEPTVT